jgi:hypothetical protein
MNQQLGGLAHGLSTPLPLSEGDKAQTLRPVYRPGDEAGDEVMNEAVDTLCTVCAQPAEQALHAVLRDCPQSPGLQACVQLATATLRLPNHLDELSCV